MSKKFRKAPSMPKWFWLNTVDGCWFCKNPNNCNHCSTVKKFRKQYFSKKEKGKNS